jgi:hypothetical protein
MGSERQIRSTSGALFGLEIMPISVTIALEAG